AALSRDRLRVLASPNRPPLSRRTHHAIGSPYTRCMSQRPSSPPAPADLERYRANLRSEADGVALYRALAEAETDPQLQEFYSGLATTEERHLALWANLLRRAGVEVPDYAPSFRVRTLGWLARRFGTQAVAPI